MVQIFYLREKGTFTEEQINRAKAILREEYGMEQSDISDTFTEGGLSHLENPSVYAVAFPTNNSIATIETPCRTVREDKRGQKILKDLARILNPDSITDFAGRRYRLVSSEL